MRLSYRLWTPIVCVLAALLLWISLLHIGTYSWLSPQDDAVQKPQLILTISQSWTDFAGACDMKHACAILTQKGIFARQAVAPWAAILGGLIVPSFLILAALCIAIRSNWANVTALCIAAVICGKIFVFQGSEFVIFHNSIAYDFDRAKVTKISPRGQATYNFNNSPVADMPIVGTTIERDNKNMGIVRGFYLRGDVPKALGFAIGLLAPLLLLLSAVALVARSFITYRHKP